MLRLSHFIAALPLGAVFASNLFVSHYSGTVNTLTLTESLNGSYSLKLNTSLTTCGHQPSWLTYNSSIRTLYCTDEFGFGTATLTSISATTNGSLTQLVKVTAMAGGVANGLYGNGYIAIAHYQNSAVTTFKLPLTSSSTALQTIMLTCPNCPGAVPSRQDAAHPHMILVDPTGAFVLVPDLGADQIRIYSINPSTGLLTACPSHNVTAGTGPRHGTFRVTNLTMLYVANELANTVDAFSVSYQSSGCLTLTNTQTLTTMAGNKTAPTGTKVAEVHIKDTFLYASNRNDQSFPPDDSMASFSLDLQGSMTFQQITDSGGTFPRTFAVNKAGDLIAIGDQTTANIAIVKRDNITGELGTQVATLRVGTVGTPENDDGLSSVLWDE